MADATKRADGDSHVIIVGGGPAGSATALNLLRIAPKVAQRSLLLEKAHHPREKICAGALTINAERMLGELDISLTVSHMPVHHTRLMYGQAAVDLPEDGDSQKVIRRSEFDAMLMQTVKDRGFAVREGVRVTKVIPRSDHVLIQTADGNYRAKVVVGADGVGTVLRRSAGFRRGRPLARLWLIEVPVDPNAAQAPHEQMLLIDLSYMRRGLKGYYWEFPCYINGQPYVSHGLVDSNSDMASRVCGKEMLGQILAERNVPTAGAKMKLFPMRHFDPKDTFAQPRRLLVGDAMGTDSLFSEGISQALASGRLAAQAINHALRQDDFSFARYGKSVRNSRFGLELRAYRILATYFHKTGPELLFSALYSDKVLSDLIGHSYAATADLHRSKWLIFKALVKHLLLLKGRIRQLRRAAGFASSA